MNDYMRAFVDGTPDAEGPIRFVAGTEGIKLDGRSFKMSGVDLTRFEANPVILWAHDDTRPPIGRGSAMVRGGQLVVDVEFDPEDEFAQVVASKYRRGFLNAVSMLPLPAGFRRGARPRSGVIDQWELVEVSAVPIPVDREAVKVGRSLMRHIGEELLDLADLPRSVDLDDAPDTLSAPADVEVSTLNGGVALSDPPSQGEPPSDLADALAGITARLDALEGSQQVTPPEEANDLEALSAIAAALPTPEEG